MRPNEIETLPYLVLEKAKRAAAKEREEYSSAEESK